MTATSNEKIGYPPLDTVKAVAGDIWIVDGAPLHPGGITMPVRMTVVRLSSGELWLHSPIRFDAELAAHLAELGPVRHLVAPNVGHWTLIADWQRHFPEAVAWAAPKLTQRRQVRKSGVRFDQELTEDSAPWHDDLDLMVVPGAGGFREVAFLHRKSRTLILTDLVQSLEPDRVPARTRLFARAIGTLYPRATAPIYLRAGLRVGGRSTRQALARLIGWQPERVIFAHGRWFERNGTAALRQAWGSLADA
ncbi:DUF4336 domain-containing protein [Palleronia sp.]|uniref:DUF4336 domain-containing protein n=1 Tax=Palleronia sp. TaxID=1940284 RepID=UPI0035C7947E